MDVFLTSPWIPAEWIRAHGLQPRGIGSEENFQSGGWPLGAGECAFAEAAVRFAEARADCAVIFATSCDQLRRGFDAAVLGGQRQVFLFNLPATWQTAAAGQMFRSELERLGQFLLTIGGRPPTGDELRQEMVRCSETRRRLLDSASCSSARAFAGALAQFHWDGSFSPALTVAPTTQIPLALLGGPFLAPHWKWLDEVEAAGGRIALNATEWGERSLSPAFAFEPGACDGAAPPKFAHSPARRSGERGFPFAALVGGYCENMIDAFQRPNTRLYSWLKPRLASRKVRGIVLWLFAGCDLWRAEAQTLRDSFGLPVLLLEAGAEPGAAPRDLNRLQAFVEMFR
jgi:hypothetical protein